MNEWRDCIITYIDLIGISRDLNKHTFTGLYKIKKMHLSVTDTAKRILQLHECVYYWNDSIIMLAFPKSVSDYVLIMNEVSIMKKSRDKSCKSYAICMKGQVIPEIEEYNEKKNKAIYLRASSLALANCFKIEEKLGKKYKKSWYIDSRIISKTQPKISAIIRNITLFPRNTYRSIYMYSESPWE